MEEKDQKDYKKLSLQLWLSTIIILCFIIAWAWASYSYQKKKLDSMKQLISSSYLNTKTMNDSLSDKTIIVSYDRRKEDSLQRIIDFTLDTLEFLEKKLKLMQSNSYITKEVIVGVLDSIDIYRKETEKLKQEIDRINYENALHLQQEKINNNILRKRIENYEKRLMALYAINMEVVTYSDGHDQNSKLVISNRAKKIEEVRVGFRLSRELNMFDNITIEMYRNEVFVARLEKVHSTGRNLKRVFKIDKEKRLKSGTYRIVIYHDNEKFDIQNAEIGIISFELN